MKVGLKDGDKKAGIGQKRPNLHMTWACMNREWYRIYTSEVTKSAHAMRCREEGMV